MPLVKPLALRSQISAFPPGATRQIQPFFLPHSPESET